VTKGERTREAILARAIEVFNVQGFSGTSLHDLMQATGLQKGGIYNHFNSKEQLAVEAFDYAFAHISERMVDYLKGTKNGLARLTAIVQFFADYFEHPPVKGGCILLNTAIESDDTQPVLRERVLHAMDMWRDLIRRTVQKGIHYGDIRPEVDPDSMATLVIATLEGAMMLTKLYNDSTHLRRAVEHLLDYIQHQVKQ
jgi:TetR/AcrR family transcriptional regulator, transcriptional repressor for nem operon